MSGASVSGPSEILVLGVDDHTLFAEGLSAVLERVPEIHVVGIAGNAADAERMALSESPRVILMDQNLPGASGIDATRRILSRRSDIVVVMLTGGATQENMLDAVEAGVSGYLSKTARAEEVTSAVRRAAAGEMLVPASVLAELLALGRRRARQTADRERVSASLTRREREVLVLMARGHDTKAIADTLVISLSTARGHVQTVIEKLDAHSRLEAVLRAGSLGLIEL